MNKKFPVLVADHIREVGVHQRYLNPESCILLIVSTILAMKLKNINKNKISMHKTIEIVLSEEVCGRSTRLNLLGDQEKFLFKRMSDILHKRKHFLFVFAIPR